MEPYTRHGASHGQHPSIPPSCHSLHVVDCYTVGHTMVFSTHELCKADNVIMYRGACTDGTTTSYTASRSFMCSSSAAYFSSSILCSSPLHSRDMCTCFAVCLVYLNSHSKRVLQQLFSPTSSEFDSLGGLLSSHPLHCIGRQRPSRRIRETDHRQSSVTCRAVLVVVSGIPMIYSLFCRVVGLCYILPCWKLCKKCELDQ